MDFNESSNFYGSLEGRIRSELFGCEIWAVAKKCGEGYARRCTAHLDSMPDELLETLQEATLAYLIDLLDEHEGEYELPAHFFLDEESSADEVMHWIKPQQIVFDNGILSDDDAPPAFSIKLVFTPVPDEFIEWVVRDTTAVYVGEYNDISPWNEKIMKKKWNYINAV